MFDAPFAKRPVHESFFTSYQRPKVDTPEFTKKEKKPESSSEKK